MTIIEMMKMEFHRVFLCFEDLNYEIYDADDDRPFVLTWCIVFKFFSR